MIYNGISFLFFIYQLFRLTFKTWSGSWIVAFARSGRRVMLSAVLCGVPFLGAGQCFYIFLYQRFIMTCFRLYVLFRQPLDHYFKLVKVPSQTSVFPIEEMRTLPSLIFWVIPFPSALRVFLPFSAQFVNCSFYFSPLSNW